MPNHVTNYLQVLGDSDRVNEFFKAMQGKDSRGKDSSFTFNAIIPMPNETLRDNLSIREQLEFPGDFNWYDWSVKHWGTKWDAYSVAKREGDRIQFDTAWSVPLPVLIAASKRFPDLVFVNEYIEETLESAGELKLQNGQTILDNHCSYADWEDLNPSCLIHVLNIKYELTSYIDYLEELMEDGDPEAKFYLGHVFIGRQVT
ncbi:MAG TPA: hypothetical protein V6C57_21060 [Coleofasciculaceae cyanobacterium]